MKRLKTESLTGSLKAPYAKVAVDHVQSNALEVANSLARGIIGNYSASNLYVLHGCVVTVVTSTAAITAGAIYYNGEIYQVAAATGIAGSGGANWVWKVLDTSVQSKFSDNNTYDWMQTKSIIFTGGLTGTGIADYNSVLVVYPLTTYNLALTNSYTSSPNATYIKEFNGFVSLQGTIFSPASFVSQQFATLPIGFRPTNTIIVPIHNNGLLAVMLIDTSGVCSVSTVSGGNIPVNTGFDFTIRFR